MSTQIPLHDGLYTWPAPRPQLLGSRCRRCGETAFPAQDDCRHCGATDAEVVPIGDRGTLWTWTIQGFLPKTPYNSGETEETFKPYRVGYVEMPGGVRVEARLRESSPEQLRIGMAMQLEIVPFRVDANGDERMTFVFRACDGE
ncbi:MAG: OB-fold domain-containing protein [Pseudomonadota bacterium]|nr:OB-fold domain-containing protein [Pseudomonadota bacterium]